MSALRFFILAILILGVFLSAISVVYVTHYQRKLFVELQQLKNQKDAMDEQWGKLQLEENTLSRSARIEKKARKKLNMMIPEPEQIIYVKVN